MQSEFRYEIIIYWSEEDQAYIAAVPELPGCTADGPTYQEALAQVEVVIGELVDAGTVAEFAAGGVLEQGVEAVGLAVAGAGQFA